jgi:hypothetical protein
MKRRLITKAKLFLSTEEEWLIDRRRVRRESKEKCEKVKEDEKRERRDEE